MSNETVECLDDKLGGLRARLSRDKDWRWCGIFMPRTTFERRSW
jgi:hypothetical protein